jgi:signal transduction histidine kinase
MRRRLVLVSLAVTSMVALAFLIPLALLVRNVAQSRAIDAAERDAVAIAVTLVVSDDPAKLANAMATTESGAKNRMTVFLPNGTTVGRSDGDDEEVRLAVSRARAFTVSRPGGVDLYQPVITNGKTAVVEVQVPTVDLERGVNRSWTALGLVALALVAVAVAAADRLGRSIVRPTRQLATAAAALGHGELDTRVEPDGPPEIADVGKAFNTLADRVQELLIAERERVADLSHRLRTPLTALRLNTEALADGEAARRVRDDTNELELVVDRLIHEARRPVQSDLGTTDLGGAVRTRARFWSVLAEDQGRALEVDIEPGTHMVRCDAGDLDAALDALLGNVVEHTHEGVAMRVSVRRDDDCVVLHVDDAGPGFEDPAAALARGRSGGGSTGLGLDIARRAAEAAGGTIVLGRSELGGADVALRFPAR